MKSSLSLSSIGLKLKSFFERYHLTLFIVLAFGSLIAVTLSLSASAGQAAAETVTTPNATKIFDQKVIDQLETLKTVEEQPANPDVPLGKRNPFVE